MILVIIVFFVVMPVFFSVMLVIELVILVIGLVMLVIGCAIRIPIKKNREKHKYHNNTNNRVIVIQTQ